MSKPYNQAVADANRRRTKHGGCVDARLKDADPIYRLWSGVKSRCLNPSTQHYARYGGRGIRFHPAWLDFAVFRDDVGERPEGATLERIDNNGHYEPGNVSWATRKEQANNRSTNTYVEHNGETRTLMQWSEHLGYSYGMMRSRWREGVRPPELMEAPQYARGTTYTYEGKEYTMPELAAVTGIPYATLKWREKNGKPLFKGAR